MPQWGCGTFDRAGGLGLPHQPKGLIILADAENTTGGRRRRTNVPLVRRAIRLTEDELEQIDRIVADQDTSLSQLVADTLLADNPPMSSAQAKALAAELMAVRNELSEAVLEVRKAGEPAGSDFMTKAETLTDRLWNMTEDQVRGR